MSELEVEMERKPFDRWLGPYSPARGIQHGLRFHAGQLGVWSSTATHKEFWTVQRNASVDRLTRAVVQTWGGGRLLFLPNGYIIKPLPGGEDERGKRVVVATFSGELVLEDSDGVEFNFAEPWNPSPGAEWGGPSTLGLECVLESDGSLRCDWYHPDEFGRMSDSCYIAGPSAARARSFKAARPGEASGRVHITPNGYVTTNHQVRRGVWETRFLCFVDPNDLEDWSHWVE
jgi:hypothetical protein